MKSTEPAPILAALRYVLNTNGGATPVHFMEDHNPMGAFLWKELTRKGYASVDANGKIQLTDAGRNALEPPFAEQEGNDSV